MSALNLADPYNRELIESAYQSWHADPNSVDMSWQLFFTGAEFAGNRVAPKVGVGGADTGRFVPPANLKVQTGVVRLINWYRQAGHLQAWLDPLQDGPPPHPLLALENFHLSDADLDKIVDASMVFGRDNAVRLRDLVESLRETYCGSVGVEFMHIDDLKVRSWLARRIEPTANRPKNEKRQKLRLLMTLHQAGLFENFLHSKYVGQKRFSLEGGETLVPMLDAIVEASPALGVDEIVIGMAHRGRLNVLANTLHKPFEQIFNEFEDMYLPDSTKDGDGDVKYHMGFSADVPTSGGGSVHLSLSPNPSHLEIVNPVVEGRVRAKQRLHGDTERGRGVPLLIHGDAAFAGQGVVAETLNLMNLAGYRTGGTVHIVINNQIGFTTGPRDARSTQYCTDIAKFIQAPVFHVNGDDPEAAAHVSRLALEFRQAFKKDVVIDLVCYRKYGHNEGDEPAFTQPLEYKKIRAKKPVQQIYTERLVAEGTISQDEADAIDAQFRAELETALSTVKSSAPKPKKMPAFAGKWSGIASGFTHQAADTAVDAATLDRIAQALAAVPAGFHLHPKVRDTVAEKRRNDILGRKPLDWGTGEALAFGSLVLEGHPVRLSGQDSRRGTFSHRHSTYVDTETGQFYAPLAHLDPKQAPFDAYDSCLSEAAVLGFEYGYSLDDPNSLVLWEAQFGDFANGAQVVIDQFVASGESKWNRSSGLVLLLPHGYEGQGPEHSSARLERFLQLCAENNMQVCHFTTPANYFHALRRQLKRPFRKPLIVMTPKSLLRLPAAVSPLSEFTDGRFREVIADDGVPAAGVKRVVLCSGKVYYDLIQARNDGVVKDAAGKVVADLGGRRFDNIAVVRVEQLYPWPEEPLARVLSGYRQTKEWVWVQEESQNMGSWFFAEPRLRQMGVVTQYVGRDASASPATGSNLVHKREQIELVTAALTRPAPFLVAGAWAKAQGSGSVSVAAAAALRGASAPATSAKTQDATG